MLNRVKYTALAICHCRIHS